ncbi:hypothetical protein BH11PSE10_BH11PSE10_13130 [soil metagenome]
MTRRRRVLLGLLAAAVLGLVFIASVQPSMMVQLSERLWACF